MLPSIAIVLLWGRVVSAQTVGKDHYFYFLFVFKNHMHVENEIHLVLECSLYNDLRNTFVNATHVDQKYLHITKEDMFKYLLSSSDHDILENLSL